MLTYARPLSRLIECLSRLPGIGPKSAQRLAFTILRWPDEQAAELLEAIRAVKEEVRECSICFNYADQDQCAICSDPQRDRSTICVVASPQDLMALERTREYRGLYHVLQGLLAPMDGVTPERLRIGELIRRISEGDVKEVVLAMNPVVEGDATAAYIARLIRPLGEFRITRIASGLPAGGDLDYADQVTITQALAGRREME